MVFKLLLIAGCDISVDNDDESYKSGGELKVSILPLAGQYHINLNSIKRLP